MKIDLAAQLREAVDLVADMEPLAASEPKSKAKRIEVENRDALVGELYDFILDRLRGYYADAGIGGEAFEAVRALAPRDLTDFDRRLRAVVEFAKLPEAEALAAANKRIGNILRQAGVATAGKVDANLVEPGAEAALADALAAAERDVAPLAEGRDYVGVLKRLAALREPVDRFFDTVMVMVDDPARRANRLNLLGRLRGLFLGVADISLLPSSAA
jgi:glycyl-tRNA synthetase beta chain